MQNNDDIPDVTVSVGQESGHRPAWVAVSRFLIHGCSQGVGCVLRLHGGRIGFQVHSCASRVPFLVRCPHFLATCNSSLGHLTVWAFTPLEEVRRETEGGERRHKERDGVTVL